MSAVADSIVALATAREQHRTGRLHQAAEGYRAVLAAAPDDARTLAEAHHSLGLIAIQQGRHGDAIAAIEQAIAIDPSDPRFCYNLAGAHRALGHAERAEAGYRAALALDPRFADAASQLGTLLLEAGQAEPAREALAAAVEAAPMQAEHRLRLGMALRQLEDGLAALQSFAEALALDPHQPAPRLQLASALAEAEVGGVPPAVIEILTSAIQQPAIDGQALMPAALAAVRAHAGYAALRRAALGDAGIGLAAAVAGGAIAEFLDLPLLHGLLARTLIANSEFETMLAGLRRHCLGLLGGGFGTEESLFARHRPFVLALSAQALNADYAWLWRDDEFAAVTRLAERAPQLARKADGPTQDLIVLSMYRPLGAVLSREDWRHWAAAEPGSPDADWRAAHLETAHRIADLAGELDPVGGDSPPLPVLSGIFPRWHGLSRAAPRPLAEIIRQSAPDFESTPALARPRVLMLGCGTGRAACEIAVQYREASVVACDERAGPLAYGRLRAEDLGIANIAFRHGGIDAAIAAGETFDVIEAIGVLLHAADPAAAWRGLLGLLAAGGAMKIGLPSRIARQPLVRARNALAAQGFGTDEHGLRGGRRAVLALPRDEPARQLSRFREFYSLSAWHDLMSPDRGAVFTLDGIERLLDQLGLALIGFQIGNPRTVLLYQSLFPSPARSNDLANWRELENRHPETFAGMYQFWCHRKA